ncbi:MAG: hypothetical protein ACP6IS_03700 [Candidatus Asgardarchaeia archaeon]
MSQWKVILSDEESKNDVTITFTDVGDVFENQIGVDDTFIQKILDLVKEKENYSIFTGIKSVISPVGTDESDKAIFMLAGEDKQGLKFAILLGQIDEKTWSIIGFWPDAFAKVCKSNNKILEAVLRVVLFDPDNWKFIEFVVPWSPFAQESQKEDKEDTQ